MESANYAQIFRRFRKTIIATFIVVLALAIVGAYLQPVRYSASVTLGVDRINKVPTNDYQYDDYYALQGAEIFANNVASWLESPAVVKEILDEAKYPEQIDNLRQLARFFRAEVLAAQTLEARFTTADQQEADQMADAMKKIVADKASTTNLTYENKPAYEVTGSDPLIVQTTAEPWLVILIGAIVGLILGYGLALLFNFFNIGERRAKEQETDTNS